MERIPDKRPIWYIVNIEGALLRPKDKRYLMMVRSPGEDYLQGALTFPGGKIEHADFMDNVLEETLRREIREEVGVEVHDDMVYVESHAFVGDGEPVVDIVFLCRYLSGTAVPSDPDEAQSVHWMSVEEILQDPDTPEWTKLSIRLVEKKRITNNW
jgi:8-oxo-dGTP pyrophosphatase MutT (NUDIX family)